jgi:hypothetical protein
MCLLAGLAMILINPVVASGLIPSGIVMMEIFGLELYSPDSSETYRSWKKSRELELCANLQTEAEKINGFFQKELGISEVCNEKGEFICEGISQALIHLTKS